MKAIIKKIIDEATGIKSFQMETEQKINFLPGQWMYVTLPGLKFPDESGPKRHFTISASPTEPQLQFTTKLSESGYKKTLWEMSVGETLEIAAPFGSFVLDKSDLRQRLFVAGGIGITPFRSMIKYVIDEGINIPVTLLYANKTRAETAFYAELGKIAENQPDIKIVNTVTGDDPGWTGHTGRIEENLIKSEVPNYPTRSWFLCGPPAFVEAMTALGQKMKIPNEQIRSEEFTGYT